MALIIINGEQVWNAVQPDAPIQVTDHAKFPTTLRMFPLGAYFDRSDGWLPATARALARFFSRLWRRKAAMEKNMDPRQADELLEEWEQLYGLDPDPALTDDDRRDAVLTKVRSLGGNTAEYYEALANDFGYAAAVVTDAADPFTTISPCDDFLAGGEWKLTFLVTAGTQGAARDAELESLINSQLLAGWFALYEFTP